MRVGFFSCTEEEPETALVALLGVGESSLIAAAELVIESLGGWESGEYGR